MGIQLNKETYEKLIDADLDVLSKLEDSIEKNHIISVLKDSVDFYYQPRAGKNEPSEKEVLPLCGVVFSDDKELSRFQKDIDDCYAHEDEEENEAEVCVFKDCNNKPMEDKKTL